MQCIPQQRLIQPLTLPVGPGVVTSLFGEGACWMTHPAYPEAFIAGVLGRDAPRSHSAMYNLAAVDKAQEWMPGDVLPLDKSSSQPLSRYPSSWTGCCAVLRRSEVGRFLLLDRLGSASSWMAGHRCRLVIGQGTALVLGFPLPCARCMTTGLAHPLSPTGVF
ncbi:hypothetical protein NEOLEDRAFT_671294 [Neolentinus lepideus HHB14362 ss-1]|uniref:Uncharacterized protein n=1 Tax=Neolentinus lepideus HHB14362 ss-1 TaxID=1314782 RepID=A0A165QBA3_9AGAM|nr:hypothetical protein NEOLEDRAFT_671294 [Neolentinus lepideus HHB14362 ss-1]